MSTKLALRRIYTDKRMQLPQAEYERMCLQIFEEFTRIDLEGINCVHVFYPIPNRREPDTLLIRNWLNVTYPDIKIVYPKTNFDDFSMQSFVADAALEMGINTYGIPEPVSGNQVDAKAIDLILLPLLAFDKLGYRVGYGKGFYDRFIAQCRPDVNLIGLSLFEPIDQIDDRNAYDLKMSACITPNVTWQFSV